MATLRAPPRAGAGRSGTVASASITRESSPPEPISRSGPGGTPGLGAIMNSTASPPAGPALARAEGDLEGGVCHRQGRELLAHRELQTWRMQLARLAQSADVIVERRLGLAQARGGLRERHLGADQLIAPRTRAGGVVEHGGERPTVLAHQPLDARQALFDRVERAVLADDPLAVAAQLGGQILETRSRARAYAR